MNATSFRKLYDYHFALNHRLWKMGVVPLTLQQFREPVAYSVGSVRNQMVHLYNMEQRWFCALHGKAVPRQRNPIHFGRAEAVREVWDAVEVEMHNYLEPLTDSMLAETIDNDMAVWEVLFHVLNHGTDHRAQTLVALSQLGAVTFPQNYALFVTHKS